MVIPYVVVVIDVGPIWERFSTVAPFLDERGRRLVAAAEAFAAGYGGIHWPIPQRHCRVRRRDRRPQHQTGRVPRRVELHHLTEYLSAKLRVYFLTSP